MRHTRSSRDWYFGEPLVLRVAEASEPGGDGAVTVTVEGPGQLGLSYQLQGLSTGELVALGEADSSGAGSFTVPLGTDLAPGLHRLGLAGYSDEVAVVVEHTIDLDFD